MKNPIIPILMLALGAFIAWFLFFRNAPAAKKTVVSGQTGSDGKVYQYGAPIMPYDVPGPLAQNPLTFSPYINPGILNY